MAVKEGQRTMQPDLEIVEVRADESFAAWAQLSRAFPEFARVQTLLADATSGLLFSPSIAALAKPLMEALLEASGLRRVIVLLSLFELLVDSDHRERLLAALGAGLVDDAAAERGWVTLAARATPDATRQAFYRERFALYKSLYPTLRDAMHRL
jgi:hypothetical protein